MDQSIETRISPHTRFIISTSGRPSSMARYKKLLQEELSLDIVYLPLAPHRANGLIDPQDFTHIITGLGAIGGAISKDIKGKVIPFLDQLDDSAKQVQSVNTVINKEGKLIGYNTDAMGFSAAIREGIKNSGETIRKAVVYGYGGVFNVVYHELKKLGIEVVLTGRNPEKVGEVSNAFGLTSFTGEADLFVNATPVTDEPLHHAENFLDAIKNCSVVFDHHMPGQALMDYCAAERKHYIPGTAMYYPQMIKQWALFLKAFVSADKVESALNNLLSQ